MDTFKMKKFKIERENLKKKFSPCWEMLLIEWTKTLLVKPDFMNRKIDSV